MENCNNCKFWFSQNIDQGKCKRYPSNSYNEQPVTEKNDWCGEWKSKHPIKNVDPKIAKTKRYKQYNTAMGL